MRFLGGWLRRGFDQGGRVFGGLGRRMYRTPMERRVAVWYQNPNHGNLRFDYALDRNSLVFDLGGYEGQWASDIYSRYCCTIHVFEPVDEYADRIRQRFAKNGDIILHPFGLGRSNTQIRIGLSGDGSSMFQASSEMRQGNLVKGDDFLVQNGIAHIDLMKINIEGGEYELLEHLLDTGLVSQIENIQVQFHDFVPDAEKRMHAIQARLTQSHTLTYQVAFVWENWRIKPDSPPH